MSDEERVALTADISGQKWTRADDEMLSALLTGATRMRAAQIAGVSERTVRRRREDPAFRRRLANVRAATVAEVVARIAAEANTALDALLSLCREADSEAVRCRAAGVVLDSLKGWLDVEQRVSPNYGGESIDVDAVIARAEKYIEQAKQQESEFDRVAGGSPVSDQPGQNS